MIVLDASALVEFALGTRKGSEVASRIKDPAIALHAPHLIDVEAAQALRRLEREGEIDEIVADRARGVMRDLDLRRHSHEPLLERIWDLRAELSAHDAAYVALAEAVETKVLTCDGRLARAPAAAGRVDLVEER